ncbi:DUF1694 domain-containing protein [Vagococcus zengguangii]|uniref:DUF1694 domain-containing protein n=1 Tax=Vagococcus zengguangii TaxID=2571750 RepID=A0A4D7CUX3_9ENTE|nr:DUF1694 domain-containing protein [Vagococcus zengguangii]QCI87104.1 DUF1694 domain-containing protein [Vagococcus zengguangii]
MKHNKDINNYIQKEFSGTNNFKQSEKNQYLGVLVERIYILIKKSDVNNKAYQTTIENIIANNPGGKIKINADLEMKSRLTFIKIAQKHNTPFTLVDNDTSLDSTTQVAAIYHFEQPTHQDKIDVSEFTM